jgi:hypothetical protein
MTAATYTNAKARKPAAKPVRARAARSAATPSIDDEPMFSGVPAYSRIHERKSSRLPLIAGSIAVVATIALVAGTSRTARDAEPFAPTQTASVPPAMSTATPVPAPTPTPDAQLIAPAPAPVVRQQARVTPPATPAPEALSADDAGQNASAIAPATPAPIAIPQVQTTPEAEAIPAPQPAAPQTAIPEVVAPEAAAPM